MIIVPESQVGRLITPSDCLRTVENVFASMARKSARNFPVVREAIGYADALFGFKSGFDREGRALGLKAGGFWPGNTRKGLTNHQSSVFLFDPDTGCCRAIVGGNLLTALRTAAASAISIKYLARENAEVLGIIGAGHQSAFQLSAALDHRQFERIVAWNYHPGMFERIESVARERKIKFEVVDLDRLGAEADVIITITSSFSPILMRAHVRPGTHIACMGTDTKGKQEVDARLVAAATVFTDDIAQSTTIGECQHAIAQGLIQRDALVEIGHVIAKTHPGRTSDSEITLFDGTGVALQDLAVAAAIAELAVGKGLAVEVET